MSTSAPSVLNPSNLTKATQTIASAKQVTKPGVTFNPILNIKEFKETNSPINIASQRPVSPPTSSKPALKPIIASAQQTVSAAKTVVKIASAQQIVSAAKTVVKGEPVTKIATEISNDNNNSTNSNDSKSNGSNSNDSNDSNSNDSKPTQSNDANENTEEPEIKSITIYNKTFLVETKVKEPLTEEQKRLANHLYLFDFEGKDDAWRHSVLKEVIEGCTGDFSVTVGAQCHSFRSYLEELAQKVFDEDKPIVWEGEEEGKDDEDGGTKKRKILRKKEGEGDGRGDGRGEGKGDGKEEGDEGKGKGDGKGDGDKEYEITISISLSDLRTLLTSMPVTGSETPNKSMTLDEAKDMADELYKVFPKESRTKLYNIIINNEESPFRNTPQTKNTANSKEFAKIISPTYAGSEPLSNTIETLKVNNILLTDAQKLKLYTTFINVMNKISPPKLAYTLG